MKTYSPKPEHIQRHWFVVDAGGQVLGRLASEVASVLRGKHKPIFAPHMDTGDHVIVINADRVELTGKKKEQKVAWRHSGYPGGIKGVGYARLLEERPVRAVEKAVRGMLPKNRLGRQMIKKLHVVPGAEHPHEAQKPESLALGQVPAWEGLPVLEVVEPKAVKKPKPAAAKTAEAPDTTDEALAAASPAAAKPKAAAAKPKATAAKKPAAAKPKAAAAKKPAAAKPKAAAAKKPAAKKPAPAKKAPAKKTEE